MSDGNDGGTEHPMRSDARRNRQRLLDAATELILEIGGEPSRDAVARRAGVGIATLYRHFPDQQDLLRAVVIDALDRTIAAGEAALADPDGARSALHRYLHAAIDNGLGVVNIAHPLLENIDWPEQTAAAQNLLDRLMEDARTRNALTDEVTATDVGFAAIRFSRPLAIGLDPTDERAISHRQLDHYLDGLAVQAGHHTATN
ncbi:MAG: TetR/AcrR family transcriptional regulator [Acidimicrobiia bacterium]